MPGNGNKRKRGDLENSPTWNFREGPWYEDLEVGKVIAHPRGRTVSEADCLWESLLSGDRNQIHINKLYTEEKFKDDPFRGRLAVNGLYVLMLINSITSPETSVSGVFLGVDEVRMVAPVFVGDTLTATSKVTEKRLSSSRPRMGIVKIKVDGYKNLDEVVITYSKSFMIESRN